VRFSQRTEGHFLQGELYSTASIRELLEDESGCYMVALDGGKPAPHGVVGMCRIKLPSVSGGDAHLSTVVVKEESGRRGIGTAMVESAVAMCQAAGCARLGLHFPSERKDMQAFYKARGFVWSHEEPMPDKYRPLIKPAYLPMGLVWMFRSLSPSELQ
jgi:ribosomal protein S18 acetylase RimI-like enzyme